MYNLNNILPIKFKNVCLSFRSNRFFNNLTLEIMNKGISIIMGPNGSGKSLILKLMSGLLEPDYGIISHANKSVSTNLPCGFVFQKPILLRRTVRENLSHPLYIIGLPKKYHDTEIQKILPNKKWQKFLNFPAKKLSVGEQQILSLLRALIIKPKILFLDEPSSSLDPKSTSIIENLVRQATKQEVKVVMTTHDIVQTKRLADEILYFENGKLIEQGIATEILSNPKSRTSSYYVHDFG